MRNFRANCAVQDQTCAVHHFRAMEFFRAKMMDKALQEFNIALTADPNDAFARSDLGVLHFYRGDIKAAEACWDEVLELDPKHAGTLFNLGLLYRNRCEFDLAEDMLEKCLAAKPDMEPARHYLFEIRKLKLELHELTSAAKQAPSELPAAGSAAKEKEVHTHYVRAIELFRAGDMVAARREFDFVLQARPLTRPRRLECDVVQCRRWGLVSRKKSWLRWREG